MQQAMDRTERRRAGGKGWVAWGLVALGLWLAASASASEVKHFRLQGRDALLQGELDGLSVDALGRLALAPRAERLSAVEEPYLLAAAAHPNGWVVGTGNSGRVLQVDRRGTLTTLFEVAESQVFAVWADADGTVWAGSSPAGKVYRWRPGGAAEAVFDPGQGYIWAIARHPSLGLLVATGADGQVVRLDAEGGAEVLYASEEEHVRSLEIASDGTILVGTAGDGKVLRLTADGDRRLLHGAPQPEVVALASAPDGVTYVAGIDSEATLVERSADGDDSEDSAGGSGTSGSTEPANGGSRSKVRSEIFRIARDGQAESVWAFEDETIYALEWSVGRLWIATGQEGKLYSFDGETMVLEKEVDERQIVALIGAGGEAAPGPAFATTNAAALYRFVPGRERNGTYVSPPQDAGTTARFGTLHWDGDLPPGAELAFSARSGNSSDPDETWTPFRPLTGEAGTSLGGVPAGRYVQWKAELRGGGDRSPVLRTVEVSYLQRNLAPKITSLSVMEPGEILVPSSFNPSNQVYEPAHPNGDGIFTSLTPTSGRENGRQKTLRKRGFRTVRWAAEDANGDDLLYDLEVRPVGAAEDAPWLSMVEGWEESWMSFDATVLPDGRYRFRLRARDGDGGEAEVDERVSEPVTVDHSPPRLTEARIRGGVLELRIADGGNPLREAVVSADAAAWRPAKVADGLLDSRGELLRIELPDAASVLLLRLMDAAYNTVTLDLSEHLP